MALAGPAVTLTQYECVLPLKDTVCPAKKGSKKGAAFFGTTESLSN